MRAILFDTNLDAARSIASAMERAKFPTDLMEEKLLHHNQPCDLGLEAYGAILLSETASTPEIIKSLRASNLEAAIIPLLPHRNARATAAILGAGADDVVIKPINGEEMAARIRAIHRRGFAANNTLMTAGDLTIYFDGRDPEVRGKRLKLSHREHAIFMYLARHMGRVITKESVYNAVYGSVEIAPHDKVIDVYICKIRKKIADMTGNQHYIETVYGRGYKFDLPKNTAPGRVRIGRKPRKGPQPRITYPAAIAIQAAG
ncbi:DNA-binding response regulator [Iodidimonas muriae]|uniref:DNA-binding response regulator n=1 Tax=Iodidimonas muriae TaxID=261467 RepID=A0ABQ2LFN5_9PROT|nr:response regulator transcription factor [Iodidimonas muriae]GER08571.1 DNA-binding response regulator [Kordiimonadales bacterium JCM 17843]GGO15589.1 DNA-binding response regulator [Iodidimonas muriae]